MKYSSPWLFKLYKYTIVKENCAIVFIIHYVSFRLFSKDRSVEMKISNERLWTFLKFVFWTSKMLRKKTRKITKMCRYDTKKIFRHYWGGTTGILNKWKHITCSWIFKKNQHYRLRFKPEKSSTYACLWTIPKSY